MDDRLNTVERATPFSQRHHLRAEMACQQTNDVDRGVLRGRHAMADGGRRQRKEAAH